MWIEGIFVQCLIIIFTFLNVAVAINKRGSSTSSCKLENILNDPAACSGVFSKLVYPDQNTGKLVYKPFNSNGETLPDFSNAGYNYGDTDLPSRGSIKVVQNLSPDPNSKDDYQRLQGAIDAVGKMSMGSNGFRGAIQLAKGKYWFSKPLMFNQSGVVFQGDPSGGTVIVATPDVKPLQEYMISINGKDCPVIESKIATVTTVVPFGTFNLTVDHPEVFKVGDSVRVEFTTTQTWINALKMNNIIRNGENHPWSPSTMVAFRQIRGIKGNVITMNAPFTTRVEQDWGKVVVKGITNTRVQNIGVQDIEFQFPQNKNRTPADMLKDGNDGTTDYKMTPEAGSTILVEMDGAENTWFRNVNTTWFRNYCKVWQNNVAITFIDNMHTFPDGATYDNGPAIVSQSAYLLMGQLILVDHCTVTLSVHALTFLSMIPGPNVIRRTTTIGGADVGPHMHWSTAQLYENNTFDSVLRIENRYNMGTGQGWAGAYSVAWNTVATHGVSITKPPIAQNFDIGSSKLHASIVTGPDTQWGYEESPGQQVYPISLYAMQLKEHRQRLNSTAA